MGAGTLIVISLYLPVFDMAFDQERICCFDNRDGTVSRPVGVLMLICMLICTTCGHLKDLGLDSL